MSRGPVAFYDFSQLPAAQAAADAAHAVASEMSGCLGPGADPTIDKLEAGAREVVARVICAQGRPGDPHYFDGGPPSIKHFDTDRPGLLSPNLPLTLSWEVEGADRIDIVVVSADQNQELPDIPGPLPVGQGSYTTAPIVGAHEWKASYELRAYNRCTRDDQPNTARLDFEMRRRVALALSGGGAKGDFEIGVCKFLRDHGVVPEIIAGTSVGSINAAKLAEGPSGFDSLDKLEAIWRSLQRNGDMYEPEPWLKDALASKIVHKLMAGHFEDLGSVGVEAASRWVLFPPSLLSDAIVAGFDIDTIASLLKKIKSAVSIYNLNPIRKKLNDPQLFSTAKVAGSNIELRLAAVGLESGDSLIINQFGQMERVVEGIRSYPAGTVPLIEAVMASASIPAVFPPVRLGDQTCVDGGVREMMPVQAARAAGGVEIYAVYVTPPPHLLPSFGNAKLPAIALRSIGDLMVDELAVTDRQLLARWGPQTKVILIQPTFEVHDTLTIDPGLIDINIAYGYMRAGEIVTLQNDRARLAEAAFNSDEIVQARRRSWIFEYGANGKEALGTPKGGELQVVADPDSLRAARGEKRKLFDLVKRRGDLGLPIPPGAQAWWTGWEPHPWMTLMPSPWARWDYGIEVVEAEQPPA